MCVVSMFHHLEFLLLHYWVYMLNDRLQLFQNFMHREGGWLPLYVPVDVALFCSCSLNTCLRYMCICAC